MKKETEIEKKKRLEKEILKKLEIVPTYKFHISHIKRWKEDARYKDRVHKFDKLEYCIYDAVRYMDNKDQVIFQRHKESKHFRWRAVYDDHLIHEDWSDIDSRY